MNQLLLRRLLVAALSAVPVACTTIPETDDQKSSLSTDSHDALQQFKDADPTLQPLLDSAAGYAVLPDITKAAVIVGGAHGAGEVYEKGVKVGYCELSLGTIGAQLGGDAYSELIVFRDQKALDSFKSGELTFAASATAVAIKPGAAQVADHAVGTTAFVRLKGGLMAEAAIGGQKLRFKPL